MLLAAEAFPARILHLELFGKSFTGKTAKHRALISRVMSAHAEIEFISPALPFLSWGRKANKQYVLE